MKKQVVVTTNAVNTPILNLTISGTVEKFAEITPRKAVLRGPAGTELHTTVIIEPSRKNPFKITDVEATTGENIRWRLENVTDGPGAQYRLTVENLKTQPGHYFDVLNLKTDSKIRPQLKVWVFGDIRKPVEGS